MRFLWILLCSLVCAGWAVAAALLASSAQPAEEPEQRLQQIADGDAARTRELLALSCQHDARLQAVLLELSAAGRAQAPRALVDDYARRMNGEVSLLQERRGSLQLLAQSRGGTGVVPAEQLIRCAEKQRCAAEGSRELLDSCSASRDNVRLWLVRKLQSEALLREAQLRGASLESAPGGETRQLLQLAMRPDAQPLKVRLLYERNDERWFSTLLTLGALSFCFGGALATLLTRKRPVDEQVLDAIETAAQRVAQGDLSSQISLTVRGRADQTLRSFDRMTAELRDMRVKLADAERAAAWQDMARRIAHEIKNPLSPIKMAIETLRKAHAKRLSSFDEIFEESTLAIREEVERMEHIVREFSEFARLPKARPGALDLSRLVHDTVGLYAREDVALSVQTPDSPVMVHADREQLIQVLVNLLTNAFDAVLEAADKRVVISVLSEAAVTTLWVEDSGRGVPPEQRERVFEPYVTTKAQGTGLGLAIVRRIVQDHGGQVTVEQGALGGARFVLTLPAARNQPSASIP